MKVFVLAPNEDWICDRFVAEWVRANPSITTANPADADVVWLLADWSWQRVPFRTLKPGCRVIATVHHIVPSKFDAAEFSQRDALVHAYHVPCRVSERQVAWAQESLGLPKKPIFVIPFWVNGDIWFRERVDVAGLGLPTDALLVGSFQRDTEGSDLVSPKLEKGPDIFCDVVETLASTHKNVAVVLAGWRRQYVMNRLQAAGIRFYYCERPGLSVVRKLYSAVSLYVVGARFEGGPQAIPECAAMRVPIVSTDVGLACEVLDTKSVFDPNNVSTIGDAVSNAMSTHALDLAESNVTSLMMPRGFQRFHDMVQCVRGQQ